MSFINALNTGGYNNTKAAKTPQNTVFFNIVNNGTSLAQYKFVICGSRRLRFVPSVLVLLIHPWLSMGKEL